MQISTSKITRIDPQAGKNCSKRDLVLTNVTMKSEEQTVSIQSKDGKLYAHFYCRILKLRSMQSVPITKTQSNRKCVLLKRFKTEK